MGIKKITQWFVIIALLLSLASPIAALSPSLVRVASAQSDADGDMLSDDDEAPHGTDPANADSDDDGLTDGEEAATYLINPRTSLSFTGGQFQQNWKTPKATGCYKVEITTTDAESAVAYFRMK